MSELLRIKTVDQMQETAAAKEGGLARRLTVFDLVMLGIGVIIGAGIFVLTGEAAAKNAGPAIVLSFIVSGVGCALAGFCYAEMASMVPLAGSAYTYAYATLGEIFAWIIGWDLILEYAVGAVTVAVGWSSYLVKLIEGYGVKLPDAWTQGPLNGGIFNVPAFLLVVIVSLLLITGVKESARVTGVMVVVKVAIVLVFLGLGIPWVRPANWSPFAPFGAGGVIAGAGVIFFAYIGFDALTTTSEEVIRPQRDLPIGILGSLGICTVLYIAVSLVLTGMVPYQELGSKAAGGAPVAFALQHVGINWGVKLVSLGAVIGLASVVLVLLLGQPRIFFAMSRDGLLPPWVARVHPRFQTPYRSILITGSVVALCAGTIPIKIVGEMTSIGTLFAFVLVCIGVAVLRRTRPELPRSFRTPLVPYVPIAGAIICLVMMAGLPWETWLRFVVWLIAGLLLYFTYGSKHAAVAHPHSEMERTPPAVDQ